jgi:hypothetical protein
VPVQCASPDRETMLVTATEGLGEGPNPTLDGGLRQLGAP